MALHPQDDRGSDRPRDEQPKADAKPKAAPKAVAAPAPDVLAQMATPIYASLIAKWASEPSGVVHEDKMADAIEQAQGLWVAAHHAPTAAPVNVDVPMVEQNGTVLACTMGNWENVPTGYSYQWQLDGAPVGQDASWYQTLPADVGRKGTCLVTARNGLGETVAPVSNAVVVEKVST